MSHIPVLLEESIDFLRIIPSGNYFDGTYGEGGHSNVILKNLNERGRLFATDLDLDAIEIAKKNMVDQRFSIFHSSFGNIKSLDIPHLDGAIFDFGMSSNQLDDPSRGFSFKNNGPIDMRMNTESNASLKKWINNAPENEIENVIKKFGEESNAKKISRKIIEVRQNKQINNTNDLAEIIKSVSQFKKSKIHPATKTFQAFRIFINNELDEIQKLLSSIDDMMKVGSRLVFISFHSLEDRLIKNFFRPKKINYPRDIPINNEIEIRYKSLGKKIRASEDEIKMNPRSRSAILRAFEKI